MATGEAAEEADGDNNQSPKRRLTFWERIVRLFYSKEEFEAYMINKLKKEDEKRERGN